MDYFFYTFKLGNFNVDSGRNDYCYFGNYVDKKNIKKKRVVKRWKTGDNIRRKSILCLRVRSVENYNLWTCENYSFIQKGCEL